MWKIHNKIIFIHRFIVVLLVTIVFNGCSVSGEKEENDLPNILWNTSEDNSTLADCYGDAFARVQALNALNYTYVFHSTILSAIEEMVRSYEADKSRNRCDLRVVEWFYQKCNIKKDNLKTNFAL